MQVPSVATGPTLSDDGQYMWDGVKWIPIEPRQPQSQKTVFLTPSLGYSKLTAQVDFLGNQQLASDMRSIPLSSTNSFVFFLAIFVSIMLILLVVPMVLTVLWGLREGRNKQRREQMTNSAVTFIRSTPVPPEKAHMASQFM
jgi:hypothetical protein